MNRTADGPRPPHFPTAMGLGKSIAFLECEAAATGDRSRSGSWSQCGTEVSSGLLTNLPVAAGVKRRRLLGSQNGVGDSTRHFLCRCFGVVLALMMFGGLPSHADDQRGAKPKASDQVSFIEDIAPVLNKKCVACHGPEKSKGHYRLDTFELLLKPGDSEMPPVVAGETAGSHLFQLLTAPDPDDRMPQKDDALPDSQITLIKRWIEEGAAFDGGNSKAPLATLIPRQPHPNPPETYPFPVPIRALAFSPDGQSIAAGGYHEITFWNATNGVLLRRIKDLPERIQGISYNADGSWLAAVGGSPGQSGELTLVNPHAEAVTKILGMMPDVMLAVAFSPDGQRVAAGGTDNSIHIYDVESGREQLLIQQHADWVMALAWSPSGAQLASASRDRTARVYNTQTGDLENTYTEHGAPVYAVAFNGDGKQVFTAGRDRKIHRWNVADAKKAGDLGGFEDEIYALLFADGKLWSVSADKLVREHAPSEKKLVRSLAGHVDRAYALTFDSGRNRLATGSHDGEVRIWDLNTGEPVLAFAAFPGGRAQR
ncbi:MAG: hypothetical protein L0Z50_27910 [Verrucomicrobiales bacterium]|nr:hypothetical protein [Verrucomicrobiales bacterium]